MDNSGALTVRANVRSRQGSTESRFEDRVAAELKRLKLFTYHVAERWYAGIPDRYVVGGNWIEFKVMPFIGVRPVNPIRLFKPNQRNFLDNFHNSGDRTWAAIQFQPENDKAHMIIMPWMSFKEHGPWTMTRIKKTTFLMEDIGSCVEQCFGKQYGQRFSHYDY